jgi:hypothetical protein
MLLEATCRAIVDDRLPEIFLYDNEVEVISAVRIVDGDIASCNRESSRSTWAVASAIIPFLFALASAASPTSLALFRPGWPTRN